MKTTQDRQGDDGLFTLAWHPSLRCRRNRLLDALMRPNLIEGVGILPQDPATLTFVQDEEVIEALPSDTPEEAFDRRELWSGDLTAKDEELLPEQRVFR